MLAVAEALMREIVMDTETTGLDPAQGHRIVEIGGIELIHHVPTGRHFHEYVNPERNIPADAFAVHGLSDDFLSAKRVFAEIVQEFLDFLGDATLIFHNAAFDVAFLNAELAFLSRQAIRPERVIDSLLLARQRHPMAPNSLDALCKRYGIDNTRRRKHGALLDAELLSEVYIELIGGKQPALTLSDVPRDRQAAAAAVRRLIPPRPHALPPRLTHQEIADHERMIESLGTTALWRTNV
jgi:DNA polymerase III subunit epsilon